MLKSPPAQTIRGVILYHRNPRLDDRIRKVKQLHDHGHDVGAIQARVGVSRRSVFNYFRQVDLARIAYIQAFPEDFEADVEALKYAILERRNLDQQLRGELALLENSTDVGCRVAIYKLILHNLRCLEDLLGFRVTRIAHEGEIAVKDTLKELLARAPGPVRDAYLDALAALIAAAGVQAAEEVKPD